MDQSGAYAFKPRALGGIIYSPDGVPYDQRPRVARGMRRRADLVLGAIKDWAGMERATDARDADLTEKTGLERWTVQRALQDLEELGIISRIRAAGRRVIELVLLRDKPESKAKAPARTKESRPSKEPDRVPAADQSRADTAKNFVPGIIGNMRKHGLEPVADDGRLCWRPIPDVDQTEPSEGLWTRARHYTPEILASVRAVPKRE